MSKMFWIHAMIAMTVLLLSAPLLSHAAELGPAAQQAAGPVLTLDNGTTWTCTYHPEQATSEYFRGRAGQLERRAGQEDRGNTGRLVCTAPSGEKVRIFTHCQL